MLLGMCGVVAGDLRLLRRSFGIACTVGLGRSEMAGSGLLQVFARLLMVLLQGLVGSGCGGFGGSQGHGVLSEWIKACRSGASTACTSIFRLQDAVVCAARHPAVSPAPEQRRQACPER